MNLYLYQNSSETNVVDKSSFLEEITHLTGTLKAQTSIVKPTIIVEIDYSELKTEYGIVDDDEDEIVDNDSLDAIIQDNVMSFLNTNYAYIPELQRYYFITDIRPLTNVLWEIDMKCDVLMSSINEIKSLKAYISRNQFEYNLDIFDEFLNYEQDVQITYEQYYSTLFDGTINENSFSYVVTTIGDETKT